MLRASTAAWINTPYRKTKMTQPTNVNTTNSDTQVNNANVSSFPVVSIRQQLYDIESQTVAAHALCEIAFEELDRVGEFTSNPAGLRAVLHLDAVLKSICRNVVLIQESAEIACGVLLESQGVAA